MATRKATLESSATEQTELSQTQPLTNSEESTNTPVREPVRQVEVVVYNSTVMHSAPTEEEARQWANENLDYRYIVEFREVLL